jgi:hypothetical protein
MNSRNPDYTHSGFLLLLCNDSFTEQQKRIIKEAVSSITDWDAFSDLAIKNGVAAVVSASIDECGVSETIPLNVRAKLEALRNKALARVVFISSVAAQMAGMLEEIGIKMILLKGLALEYTVYGAKGLRQMNDADVLIQPHQAIDAWYLLQEEGFICRPLKSPLYRRIIMCIGNHLPELHRNGISVDIHHRLFQKEGTALTQKGIDEAHSIDISGRTCYILPPRIAFLGMIKHIQKHAVKGEFQVRLYLDLFLMLKHKPDEILGTELLRDAREAGISRDLSGALLILSKYWGIQIPETYLSDLNASDREKYLSAFMTGLNNPGRIDPDKSRDIYKYNLKSIEGSFNKLIFLLGDIFPSVAFMKERYRKKSLVGILPYYPLRTGKVFWFLRALLSQP